MTTYDLHQHLWPQAFVEELLARTTAPCLDGGTLVVDEGRFPFDATEHELELRLAALDRDEIDVAVVSLQPTLGIAALDEDARSRLDAAWVSGMRELVGLAHGRLAALAPDCVLDGFVGTSVSTSALTDLDSCAPLLDEVSRGGGVLFVHPGPVHPRADAPPWWAGIVDYAADMQAAWFSWLDAGRSRWPELRVVFSILAGGAPFHLERLALRSPLDVRSMLDANVYLDVATHGRRAIELCIETFGVEQLVYGSDAPVVDPAPTLRAIRGFGHAVTRIVQSDNPARLLQ